jgi:hypothetical protein
MGNPVEGGVEQWGKLNKKTGRYDIPLGYTTKWTQRQTLSPEAQDLYDKSLGMMQGRMGLAEGMMGRVGEEMAGAPDWDQFGDVIGYDPTEARARAEESIYQKQAARLDPQFEQQQIALETDLRNRGLRPGDQAYDSAMQNFTMARSDAYEQARLGSVAAGQQEAMLGMDQNQLANALRQQEIEEYLGKRGFSLSEMERLAAGQTAGDLAEMISGQGTGGA